MASIARIVTAFALPTLLVACTGSGTETPEAATSTFPATPGVVIAEVGGIKISAEEYEAAASRKVPADGVALSAEEKQAILDELVVEKMLYLEAKKRGIDQDPKVQKVMVNTLLRQDVYAHVRNSDFTTEQLKAYYDAHQDEFVVPEKIQIRRIFVKGEPTRPSSEAKGMARKLYEKVLTDPAAFKEIASESSEDPYRRRGGDLGYMDVTGKAGIDPAIVEKAFTMQVGDVSEPFEAGGGWNVIMVSGKRERVERTFEQMKGSVLRKVKNDRYKELYAEYVEGIRGEYAVTVDDAVLDGLEVKPARRVTLGPDLGEPARVEEEGGDDDLLEDLPD